MEVGMSLNALIRLPQSSNSKATTLQYAFLKPHSDSTKTHPSKAEASGGGSQRKERNASSTFPMETTPSFPSLPKIDADGNPKSVIFIRTTNLPKREELKTVLDKVKDFFGDAKESFGKLTALTSTSNEESGEKSKVKGLQGRVVLPVRGKLSC